VRMDGADLDRALHAQMRWNAPLSAGHAGLLMDPGWTCGQASGSPTSAAGGANSCSRRSPAP